MPVFINMYLKHSLACLASEVLLNVGNMNDDNAMGVRDTRSSERSPRVPADAPSVHLTSNSLPTARAGSSTPNKDDDSSDEYLSVSGDDADATSEEQNGRDAKDDADEHDESGSLKGDAEEHKHKGSEEVSSSKQAWQNSRKAYSDKRDKQAFNNLKEASKAYITELGVNFKEITDTRSTLSDTAKETWESKLKAFDDKKSQDSLDEALAESSWYIDFLLELAQEQNSDVGVKLQRDLTLCEVQRVEDKITELQVACMSQAYFPSKETLRDLKGEDDVQLKTWIDVAQARIPAIVDKQCKTNATDPAMQICQVLPWASKNLVEALVVELDDRTINYKDKDKTDDEVQARWQVVCTLALALVGYSGLQGMFAEITSFYDTLFGLVGKKKREFIIEEITIHKMTRVKAWTSDSLLDAWLKPTRKNPQREEVMISTKEEETKSDAGNAKEDNNDGAETKAGTEPNKPATNTREFVYYDGLARVASFVDTYIAEMYNPENEEKTKEDEDKHSTELVETELVETRELSAYMFDRLASKYKPASQTFDFRPYYLESIRLPTGRCKVRVEPANNAFTRDQVYVWLINHNFDYIVYDKTSADNLVEVRNKTKRSQLHPPWMLPQETAVTDADTKAILKSISVLLGKTSNFEHVSQYYTLCKYAYNKMPTTTLDKAFQKATEKAKPAETTEEASPAETTEEVNPAETTEKAKLAEKAEETKKTKSQRDFKEFVVKLQALLRDVLRAMQACSEAQIFLVEFGKQNVRTASNGYIVDGFEFTHNRNLSNDMLANDDNPWAKHELQSVKRVVSQVKNLSPEELSKREPQQVYQRAFEASGKRKLELGVGDVLDRPTKSLRGGTKEVDEVLTSSVEMYRVCRLAWTVCSDYFEVFTGNSLPPGAWRVGLQRLFAKWVVTDVVDTSNIKVVKDDDFAEFMHFHSFYKFRSAKECLASLRATNSSVFTNFGSSNKNYLKFGLDYLRGVWPHFNELPRERFSLDLRKRKGKTFGFDELGSKMVGIGVTWCHELVAYKKSLSVRSYDAKNDAAVTTNKPERDVTTKKRGQDVLTLREIGNMRITTYYTVPIPDENEEFVGMTCAIMSGSVVVWTRSKVYVFDPSSRTFVPFLRYEATPKALTQTNHQGGGASQFSTSTSQAKPQGEEEEEGGGNIVFVDDTFDRSFQRHPSKTQSHHAEIAFNNATTIQDIKKQLEKNRGYPVDQQVLYLNERKLDDDELVLSLGITESYLSLQNIKDKFVPVTRVCQKVVVPECRSESNEQNMQEEIGRLDELGQTKNYEACSADIALKQRLYRNKPPCGGGEEHHKAPTKTTREQLRKAIDGHRANPAAFASDTVRFEAKQRRQAEATLAESVPNVGDVQDVTNRDQKTEQQKREAAQRYAPMTPATLVELRADMKRYAANPAALEQLERAQGVQHIKTNHKPESAGDGEEGGRGEVELSQSNQEEGKESELNVWSMQPFTNIMTNAAIAATFPYDVKTTYEGSKIDENRQKYESWLKDNNEKVVIFSQPEEGIEFASRRGRAGEDAAFWGKFDTQMSLQDTLQMQNKVQDLIKAYNGPDGSTMTLVLATRTQDHVDLVAWCLGDSPLAVYDKDLKCLFGFVSHQKTDDLPEDATLVWQHDQRVQNAKGESVGVSRAIGDNSILRDPNAHDIEVIKMPGLELGCKFVVCSDGFEDNIDEKNVLFASPRYGLKDNPLISTIFGDETSTHLAIVVPARGRADDQTAFVVDTNNLEANKTYVFAVFDGHGGPYASAWAVNNIPRAMSSLAEMHDMQNMNKQLEARKSNQSANTQGDAQLLSGGLPGNLPRLLQSTSLSFDGTMLCLLLNHDAEQVTQEPSQETVKEATQQTTQEVVKEAKQEPMQEVGNKVTQRIELYNFHAFDVGKLVTKFDVQDAYAVACNARHGSCFVLVVGRDDTNVTYLNAYTATLYLVVKAQQHKVLSISFVLDETQKGGAEVSHVSTVVDNTKPPPQHVGVSSVSFIANDPRYALVTFEAHHRGGTYYHGRSARLDLFEDRSKAIEASQKEDRTVHATWAIKRDKCPGVVCLFDERYDTFAAPTPTGIATIRDKCLGNNCNEKSHVFLTYDFSPEQAKRRNSMRDALKALQDLESFGDKNDEIIDINQAQTYVYKNLFNTIYDEHLVKNLLTMVVNSYDPYKTPDVLALVKGYVCKPGLSKELTIHKTQSDANLTLQNAKFCAVFGKQKSWLFITHPTMPKPTSGTTTSRTTASGTTTSGTTTSGTTALAQNTCNVEALDLTNDDQALSCISIYWTPRDKDNRIPLDVYNVYISETSNASLSNKGTFSMGIKDVCAANNHVFFLVETTVTNEWNKKPCVLVAEADQLEDGVCAAKPLENLTKTYSCIAVTDDARFLLLGAAHEIHVYVVNNSDKSKVNHEPFTIINRPSKTSLKVDAFHLGSIQSITTCANNSLIIKTTLRMPYTSPTPETPKTLIGNKMHKTLETKVALGLVYDMWNITPDNVRKNARYTTVGKGIIDVEFVNTEITEVNVGTDSLLSLSPSSTSLFVADPSNPSRVTTIVHDLLNDGASERQTFEFVLGQLVFTFASSGDTWKLKYEPITERSDLRQILEDWQTKTYPKEYTKERTFFASIQYALNRQSVQGNDIEDEQEQEAEQATHEDVETKVEDYVEAKVGNDTEDNTKNNSKGDESNEEGDDEPLKSFREARIDAAQTSLHSEASDVHRKQPRSKPKHTFEELLPSDDTSTLQPLAGGYRLFAAPWLFGANTKRARIEDAENMHVTSMRMKRRAEPNDHGNKRARH